MDKQEILKLTKLLFILWFWKLSSHIYYVLKSYFVVERKRMNEWNSYMNDRIKNQQKYIIIKL